MFNNQNEEREAQPKASGRRQELLQEVVAYLRQNGLADVSLREIARQLNLTAPALLHHFDSKEKLLTEALEVIQQEAIDVLNGAFVNQRSIAHALRALWDHQSDPDRRQEQRAVLEIESMASMQPERFPRYHGNIQRPWVAAFLRALEQNRCPESMRLPTATLVAGSYRGLLADLLATGERRRVSASLAMLQDMVADLESAWAEMPAQVENQVA
ncbi:MAG: TetR/AcrR family transcriptional regulator [Pseudomonadota bacterium]